MEVAFTVSDTFVVSMRDMTKWHVTTWPAWGVLPLLPFAARVVTSPRTSRLIPMMVSHHKPPCARTGGTEKGHGRSRHPTNDPTPGLGR